MQTRFSPYQSTRTALLAALALSVLAACGGGGGTGGTGTTTPPPGGPGGSTVSSGVMTKGSTIVNGVRFEDTLANITIDDRPKTAVLQLQTGMVVKVVGRVNDDGINGTADRVKALVEARGRATSVFANESPQRLVLLGQTVLVDDQTVLSNLTGINAIAPGPTGTLVEVHGLRDANGQIRATRIEANQLQMADSILDEIRGVVANGNGVRPANFTLNGQAINFAGTVIPAGASWQNGSVVEVYCSVRPCVDVNGLFHASELHVEDAQDAAFQPASGQRMEVEGLISGLLAGAQNFSVGSTPVMITSSTRFEGGIATDLANNIKVEAEGSWNGTTLLAGKIEFKRSVVRLQGNVTFSGQNQFTMNVAGHSVNIVKDNLTDGAVPPQGQTCVQVRGQRAVTAGALVITAGEIRTSCGNSGRPIMQAPVEAETPTSIKLLGFDIDVSNPLDTPNQWVDVNDQRIPTLAAFLNAVTPATTNAAGSVPGTLVKVIFDDATPAVRQVEIED